MPGATRPAADTGAKPRGGSWAVAAARQYGAYTDTATGLLKVGHRFYDPALGRWTQQDPLRHLGDPRQANRYVYAGCDPINLIDPSGTDLSPCGASEAALIGGTALLLGGVALGVAGTLSGNIEVDPTAVKLAVVGGNLAIGGIIGIAVTCESSS